MHDITELNEPHGLTFQCGLDELMASKYFFSLKFNKKSRSKQYPHHCMSWVLFLSERVVFVTIYIWKIQIK